MQIDIDTKTIMKLLENKDLIIYISGKKNKEQNVVLKNNFLSKIPFTIFLEK